MKIKSQKICVKNRKVNISKSAKWFLIIVFLICIIVVIACTSFYFGAVAQKTGITQKIKKIVTNDFPQYPSVYRHFVKGIFEKVPELKIHIKFKNYKKLSDMREYSLANKTGSDHFEYVKSIVQFEDNQIPCDIRLKGDRYVHFEDKKEWSFRVSVKDNESIMGMRRFSLQKPRLRNYIYEWMYHELLKEEGLIALRYQFVKLYVNGRDLGLYALEEHFEKTLVEYNRKREGPILRFNESYYPPNYKEDDFFNIPIFPFKGKDWTKGNNKILLESAISKLEGFRKGDLDTEEVFDIGRMAKFLAITDLMNTHHAIFWKSMRFYYNPINAKLEPVGFDGHYGATLGEKLISYGFTTQNKGMSGLFLRDTGPLYKALFSNKKLYALYVKCLEKISQKQYLDNFFQKHRSKIDSYLGLIYTDGNPYKDYIYRYGPELFLFEEHKIYQMQDFIKEKLNPISHFDTIRVHVVNCSNDMVRLQIANLHSFPLQIEGIYNGNHKIGSISNQVIEPKLQSSPINYENLDFKLTDGSIEITNEKISSYHVRYKVHGTDSSSATSPILPWEIWNSSFIPLTSDEKFKAKIQELNFIHLNDGEKKIVFRSGSWMLEESLIIPKGYEVVFESGLKLDLVKNSFLLLYSHLAALGSSYDTIELHSSDKTGQGLAVLETDGKNFLNYVNIQGMTAPSRKGWFLPSSVTFYESDVVISNCYFGNNQSEDALNIFRSEFRIEGTFFEEAHSDAFDSDFSEGTVVNCRFKNIGNDGIDASGSTIDISNISLENCGDKAISCGEESKLILNSVLVKGSKIGIASKDGSDVLATKIELNNCRYGSAIFRKKTEYDFPKLDLYLLESVNVQELFLIEKGSFVRQDGVQLNSNRKNIKDLLYP